MDIDRAHTAAELGQHAASAGAEALRAALAERGSANILVATGSSQFQTLAHLIREPGIDWSKVTGFHLDEYIGISEFHPASFRRYLRERFVTEVPLAAFHYVQGDAADPQAECDRLGKLISDRTIDVAFIGIGENGHLAFNDPPADFETTAPYIVVTLDDACRTQQQGEGWFPTFDDVPKTAISMSVQQILKAKRIICSVPDERKAEPVRAAVQGPITPMCPASILQQHPSTTLYLDHASSWLLEPSAK